MTDYDRLREKVLGSIALPIKPSVKPTGSDLELIEDHVIIVNTYAHPPDETEYVSNLLIN